MSTLLIKRKDGSDLPRQTRVRIVTWPDGLRTWKGVVSRSASVDLDPGAYSVVRAKSTKTSTGKFVCFKEVSSPVYHDITKEELAKLESREISHVKGTVTTGGNRWRCTYPGCDVTDLTHVNAAKLHVLEDHFGETPLRQEPDPPAVDRPVAATTPDPPAEKEDKPKRRIRQPRRKGVSPTKH